MNFGLSDEQFQFVLQTVVSPLSKHGAATWCFGSRARGDHRPFSDLDLLIVGTGELRSIVGQIQEQVENSNFPFKIDIVLDSDLATTYRSQVEQEKKRFAR